MADESLGYEQLEDTTSGSSQAIAALSQPTTGDIDPLTGVSCEHLGNGSARWSMSNAKENELRAIIYSTPVGVDLMDEISKAFELVKTLLIGDLVSIRRRKNTSPTSPPCKAPPSSSPE